MCLNFMPRIQLKKANEEKKVRKTFEQRQNLISFVLILCLAPKEKLYP